LHSDDQRYSVATQDRQGIPYFCGFVSTHNDDITQRKTDHIDLAMASQPVSGKRDARFYYEPLLAGHPDPELDLPVDFLGKTLRYPVWVSSMTGGTEAARKINENLARMCGEFGFGMGLGSCRALLENPDRLSDFDVRRWVGPEMPLFANLGIAQIGRMLEKGTVSEITGLLNLLQADGLIVHVNPMQEWLQPEGDYLRVAPLDILTAFIQSVDCSVIVKEVGQGMGPESLSKLLTLPLAAIELGAYGGANFATLELMRDPDPMRREHLACLGHVGHTAEEMVSYINLACEQMHGMPRCKQIIISGGVRDFLDGYYLMKKLHLPAIYGQASGFLKYARQGYEQLHAFARILTAGLRIANSYLKVR
jgi:isopentenyl-diphosphate Delta-isomerase